MNNKSIGNIFKGDKVIWMVFFFLCMISIVEVYSASSSLSYKTGNYMAPVIRHILLLGGGLFTMICMLKVKCKYFKIVTPVVMGISLLLLVLVLATGQSTNGASRWFSLMGIQFQPSEIAKGAVVLAVAQILSASICNSHRTGKLIHSHAPQYHNLSHDAHRTSADEPDWQAGGTGHDCHRHSLCRYHDSRTGQGRRGQ